MPFEVDYDALLIVSISITSIAVIILKATRGTEKKIQRLFSSEAQTERCVCSLSLSKNLGFAHVCKHRHPS